MVSKIEISGSVEIIRKKWGGFISNPAFFDSLNIISFISLVLVLYHRHRDVLFLRYDGTFWLTLAKVQAEWMPTLPILTMDFLKANGELGFPVLTNILPGFLIGRLFGAQDGFSEIASAAAFAVELYIAILVLGLAFGLKRPVCHFAAWFACLITLPLFIPTVTYIRIWGNPHLLTALALNAFTIAIFYRVGRQHGISLVTGIVGIILLQGYGIVALGYVAPMSAPFAGLALVVLTLAVATDERKKKLIALIVVAGVLGAIFGPYLFGLYLYTKPAFFWSELLQGPINFSDASFFLHRHETAGDIGRIIYCGSIICTAAVLVFGRGGMRSLAGCLAVFLAAIHLSVIAIRSLADSWSGSPLGYVDLMALPLHALVMASALQLLVSSISARRGRAAPINAKKIVGAWHLIAFLPWFSLQPSISGAAQLRAHAPWPWPPMETSLTKYLHNKIALKDQRYFFGRVVNLAGRAGDYDNLFINQHIFDHGMLHTYGNDHRQYGFWYYNIPTLLSATQFTSPMFHFLTTRFLIEPNTSSQRTHVAFEKYDPRILQSLGVRYVIDDRIHDRTLVRMDLPVPGSKDKRLYLHELPTPNLGNYSPTKVTRVNGVKQAIGEMKRSDWNYRLAVVTTEDLPENLMKVNYSSVRLGKGHIRAEARSSGTSILLLPFQFSNCLTFIPDRNTPGVAPVRLFRANLAQTGVLFEKEFSGTISFRFGPFHNPHCRLRDIEEAKDLGLAEAAEWWPGP